MQEQLNKEPEYLLRNYTVFDGLPVNSVYDIAQDKLGNLYLATHDGLVLFDGYNITNFQTSDHPGLINQRIRRLMSDFNDRLWITTVDSLLVMFDGVHFTHYSKEMGVPSSIIDIASDRTGTVWIATHHGIYKKQPGDLHFHKINLPGLNNVTYSLSVSDTIIAVNEKGAFQLYNNHVELLLSADEFPFSTQTVHAITQATNNSWWIYGSEGFFLLRDSEIVTSVSRTGENSSTINIKWFDEETFIVADVAGFYKININTESVKRLQYNSPTVNYDRQLVGKKNDLPVLLLSDSVVIGEDSIPEIKQGLVNFTDREGNLWIGTLRNGLWKVNRRVVSNLTSLPASPIPNVYSFFESRDGSIWIASTATGIHKISEDSPSLWNYENGALIGNGVRYLYEDTDQTVYASIYNEGLWKLIDDEWIEWRELNEFINSNRFTVEAMFRDSRHRLLIGSTHATLVVDQGKITYLNSKNGELIEQVRTIRELGDGTLLFATNGHGLAVLTTSGELSFITTDDGLSSNYIRDVLAESDGRIWIVTENMGLNRILFNGSLELTSVRQITSEHGLHHNSLHRMILCENNYFWISSNRGVIYIHADDLNSFADGKSNFVAAILLDELHGMQNRELNGGVQDAGLILSDGNIWFPNMDGIVILDPSYITSKQHSVYLTQPQIRSVITEEGFSWINDNELLLQKGTRNIRITYSSPNFRSPQQIRYYHRLSPFQKEWQKSTSSRTAEYTNLPPGRHQFEIVAFSPELSVSESQFTIIIPKFYYETAWFRFFLLLSIGTSLFVIYRIRTKSLYKWNQVQTIIRQRTEELEKVSLEKERLFNGITHDLKTPISMIMGTSESLLNHDGDVNSTEFKEKLKRIKRNGFYLNDLVSQMLEVTKTDQNQREYVKEPVDLVHYSSKIFDTFDTLLHSKSLTLETIGTLNAPILIDKKAWKRILTNLLTNAIKFSKVGGVIQIEFWESDSFAEIHIRDYGLGISPTEQQKVFDYLYQSEINRNSGGTGIGLWLVKRLVEGMNGTVNITSAENSGTTISIRLIKDHTNIEANSFTSGSVQQNEFHSNLNITDVSGKLILDASTTNRLQPGTSPAIESQRLAKQTNTVKELSTLPANLLDEMRQVIEEGDISQFKHLIDLQNQHLSTDLLQLLQTLADQYDYIRITELIDQSLNPDE